MFSRRLRNSDVHFLLHCWGLYCPGGRKEGKCIMLCIQSHFNIRELIDWSVLVIKANFHFCLLIMMTGFELLTLWLVQIINCKQLLLKLFRTKDSSVVRLTVLMVLNQQCLVQSLFLFEYFKFLLRRTYLPTLYHKRKIQELLLQILQIGWLY